MVKPLLFTFVGVVTLSLVLGSRTPSEPLRLAPLDVTSAQLTLGGEPLRDIVPLSSAPLRQADQAPERIRLSQVSALRSEGQQHVLVFEDGSELAVTPYVLNALPHELKLRLSYEQ